MAEKPIAVFLILTHNYYSSKQVIVVHPVLYLSSYQISTMGTKIVLRYSVDPIWRAQRIFLVQYIICAHQY